MNFVTFSALNNDVIKNLHKIPRDIDLVIGVPRSGLLVANILALYLNKPLISIDMFILQAMKRIEGGGRYPEDLTRLKFLFNRLTK
ncbi:MAG: hypothetical protein IJ728_04475 [Selenomonadaceae bacterium]|nr:hypothetical protein [Selenomonadaceae bacterium]